MLTVAKTWVILCDMDLYCWRAAELIPTIADNYNNNMLNKQFTIFTSKYFLI